MNIKRLREDSWMAKALAMVAAAVIRYRRLFFYPQIVLFALCALYTYKYLQFDTGRSNLVGANEKYHLDFRKFKKEFPTQEDLVVVVESEDPEKNRQFVERLGPKLEAETNLFRNVFYKGDFQMLGSKALLFPSEEELAGLKKMLEDYRPFIQQFMRITNLESLFSLVNTQFRTARREKNPETDSLIKALPALERIVTQATECLRRSGTAPTPGITALFNPGPDVEQKIYVTFADGRIFLVTTQAPTDALNGAAVERLRQLVEETKSEVSGVNVGLTGEPVLERDEMTQSEKDTLLASVVSLV